MRCGDNHKFCEICNCFWMYMCFMKMQCMNSYHLSYEINDQILKEINTFRVWILVVPKSIHHTPQFLGKKSLSSSCSCSYGDFWLSLSCLLLFILKEIVAIILLRRGMRSRMAMGRISGLKHEGVCIGFASKKRYNECIFIKRMQENQSTMQESKS